VVPRLDVTIYSTGFRQLQQLRVGAVKTKENILKESLMTRDKYCSKKFRRN